MAYATIDGTPYIFVTTSSTTQAHDLWVIDVHDAEHPEVIASYEIGDGTYTKGLLDLTVATKNTGTYAYMLQNSTTSQLVTLDVSDPLHAIIPPYTISFDTFGVSPDGSNPEGRVITYYDDKLYIGLRTTIGPELLIFETATDPARPRFVKHL
jgi:ribosomal protein L31